jgi:hypothetical protein
MSEENLKHFEFIQNVITRMNTNSFQIKEWSITLVAALLTVYATLKIPYILLIGIFSSVLFWFLDSYYLCQERKFRGLYNDVTGVNLPPKVEGIKPFQMPINKYTKKIDKSFNYWDSFFSKTIYPIYLLMLMLLIILFIASLIFNIGG